MILNELDLEPAQCPSKSLDLVICFEVICSPHATNRIEQNGLSNQQCI
jgi:hypothetical protein